MMGPMPSALDSINWEYAKAVSSLRNGDRYASFVALGRALHILQVGLPTPSDTAPLRLSAHCLSVLILCQPSLQLLLPPLRLPALQCLFILKCSVCLDPCSLSAPVHASAACCYSCISVPCPDLRPLHSTLLRRRT